MDWERVNVWTNSMYTLVHSLHLSKQIHFGNLETLHESIVGASKWIEPACSFQSIVTEREFGRNRATFRRDPNKHFESISRNFVKMLLQELVVIFDEMMADSIRARGLASESFPQSKVRQLAPYLDRKQGWSEHGCLELIAVRNVLVHNDAKWNDRALEIIAPFTKSPPGPGDHLVVGTPMLFRYRKAIRTFLNETRPPK